MNRYLQFADLHGLAIATHKIIFRERESQYIEITTKTPSLPHSTERQYGTMHMDSLLYAYSYKMVNEWNMIAFKNQFRWKQTLLVFCCRHHHRFTVVRFPVPNTRMTCLFLVYTSVARCCQDLNQRCLAPFYVSCLQLPFLKSTMVYLQNMFGTSILVWYRRHHNVTVIITLLSS